MTAAEAQKHWESAASGWVKWEQTVAGWMEPATEAMLDMAGVGPGASVLDMACGAGSQTLTAALRVGPRGRVVGSDISETMLARVRESARAARLEHVVTVAAPAEDLDVPAESFDAVICRLGLMLFGEPAKALAAARRALKPGGRIAAVVFTTPAANAFMAKPMQILLRRVGKQPPPPGRPGIFSLGAPHALERLLDESGFTDIEQRTLAAPLRMPSAEHALEMMREAFGAYRAVVADCPETLRAAAWADVAETLKGFESGAGFEAPAEVSVTAAARAA